MISRFLLIPLALTAWAVMAQSRLEITEFGKKAPAACVTLTGEEQLLSGENWNCQVRRSSGHIPVWTLRFTSSRHEPVRLQWRFSSLLDFTPARFWDGHEERDVEKLPLFRNDFLEAFPLATAEDGRRGRALGFAPQTILSMFSRGLTNNGLCLDARIAVDDRRVQEIHVVEYGFTPDFGWRNAVEEFQAAFPEAFAPQPGEDWRIHGVGGYFTGGHLQRPFELHAPRVFGLEWEWTYAPWYEAGNWFPTGEGWKGERNTYRDYYGHRKAKELTREEYHQALESEMHYGNKLVAMFYYILVKDIHQNVADAWPDAVNGRSGLHSLPSNRGKTKQVFAPGSPIFEYLKNQLKQVVENYEIAGFSFDMVNSSFLFYTPSQLEYAVGRSWDDDGRIFTSDTVLPIPFSDYIHTLSRDGKRMGTVFNPANCNFSPFTLFHCDAAIMEGPPWANVEMLLPLRLTMGRKPLSLWHYSTRGLPIRKWRIAGNPARKAQAELGFKQFYLLKCYELGFMPMNWVAADTFFHPHLSALRAISEAGYHPVCAIRDAEPFWTGRFGDDCGTILTLGNPTNETLTRSVRVVNRYLGSGKYAFLLPSGRLRQSFANGETIFNITLAPKEVLVLRAVAVNGQGDWLGTAVSTDRISLEGDGEFSFSLPARDFSGKRIRGARENFFFGQASKAAVLELLPPWRSFAEPNKMTALLAPGENPAVEAGEGNEVRIAAEMVAMYRPFVQASRKCKGRVGFGSVGFLDAALARPDLLVTSPGKGKDGKRICLGVPGDFPDFTPPVDWSGPFLAMPSPSVLWIGGDTPTEVRRAALAYFEMLDKCQVAEKTNNR